MNKKFTKLVREIIFEIAQERSLLEIHGPALTPEDAEGDAILTDEAFEDFMRFIEGLPKKMQIELITQYQDQLQQQLEDAASSLRHDSD
tara:strand:+ start:329 stop:595 length:267 start_codon:yes stop_codon:yes gene_type:complete